MTAVFLAALGADGPPADRVGRMDLYGWLIGSWDLEVSHFLEDDVVRRRTGEWHFGWVLEGRAIQDVWIVPRRGPARLEDATANSHSYGSTLRIYDPQNNTWRVQWTDPVTSNFCTMTGHRDGDDILQLGVNAAGQPVRWSFTRITSGSFLWRGETNHADGAGFSLDVEFQATRVRRSVSHTFV